MNKPGANKQPSEGNYEIVVVKAHSGGFFHESPDKYHSGQLYFRDLDGTSHLTSVSKQTLKFRKTFWCVPDDAERDEAAKSAEYNRYLPALQLYREFHRRTGKRYELVRTLHPSMPILPALPPE